MLVFSYGDSIKGPLRAAVVAAVLMNAVLPATGGPVAAAVANEAGAPGTAVVRGSAGAELDAPERVARTGAAIFNPFVPSRPEAAADASAAEAEPDAGLPLAVTAGGALLIAWLLSRLGN